MYIVCHIIFTMVLLNQIHCGNERLLLKENGPTLNELIIWIRTVSII